MNGTGISKFMFILYGRAGDDLKHIAYYTLRDAIWVFVIISNYASVKFKSINS